MLFECLVNRINRNNAYGELVGSVSMKKLIAAASLCVASFSVQAAITVPEYDANAGKQIAETVCAACHGVTGVSPVPAQPNLGGQNVKYLYKQLIDYKTGYRKNGIMQSQIANLSQQDQAIILAKHLGVSVLVILQLTKKQLRFSWVVISHAV